MKINIYQRLQPRNEEEASRPKKIVYLPIQPSLTCTAYNKSYPALGSATPPTTPPKQPLPQSWSTLSYDHILEGYDFSRSMKTSDIDDYFKDFVINVRWVDDNHVLIIFPDAGTGTQRFYGLANVPQLSMLCPPKTILICLSEVLTKQASNLNSCGKRKVKKLHPLRG